MKGDELLIVNISGRGDKDVAQAATKLGLQMRGDRSCQSPVGMPLNAGFAAWESRAVGAVGPRALCPLGSAFPQEIRFIMASSPLIITPHRSRDVASIEAQLVCQKVEQELHQTNKAMLSSYPPAHRAIHSNA